MPHKASSAKNVDKKFFSVVRWQKFSSCTICLISTSAIMREEVRGVTFKPKHFHDPNLDFRLLRGILQWSEILSFIVTTGRGGWTAMTLFVSGKKFDVKSSTAGEKIQSSVITCQLVLTEPREQLEKQSSQRHVDVTCSKSCYLRPKAMLTFNHGHCSSFGDCSGYFVGYLCWWGLEVLC